MALLERQVIFKRKDKSGNTYMEFPVTRVDYVEGAVASVNGKLPDNNQNIQVNTLDTKSTNPITTVSNDTVAKWIELGAGEYFFNASYLNDQPTASGFLCNRVTGTNVFQLFKSQPSGALYYRDGNTTNGWTSSWVELADKSWANDTFLSLGGGKMTGTIIRNGFLAQNSVDDNVMIVRGGTDATSAFMALYGKNHPTMPGVAGFVAVDDSSSTSFYVYPDGRATIGDNNLVRSVNGVKAGVSGNVSIPEGLMLKGTNPITDIANDTPEFWRTVEAGVYYINLAGVFIGQPNQWGFLVHYKSGTTFTQIWMTAPLGQMYHRGANLNGWSSDSGNWRKFKSRFGTYKTATASYTAPADGFYLTYVKGLGEGNMSIEVKVNGTTVALTNGYHSREQQCACVPVKEGDAIVTTGASHYYFMEA